MTYCFYGVKSCYTKIKGFDGKEYLLAHTPERRWMVQIFVWLFGKQSPSFEPNGNFSVGFDGVSPLYESGMLVSAESRAI